MYINFISVILPVYNSEKYLAESIKSTLRQTFSNFELIIINNASTDKSLNIIKSFCEIDKRIILIDQKTNLGMANSLNNACKLAKGDWVARMDADDVMKANRIEKQIDFLNKNKNVKVLSCLAQYIDEQGNIFGLTTTSLNKIDSCKELDKKNKSIGILHPGAIVNKKILLELKGDRKELFPCEDIDLWNRFVEQGHLIYNLKEALMLYRIHEGSAVTSKFIDSQLKYEWVKMCKKARKKNIKEPSWNEFNKYWKKTKLIFKLNKYRKIYHKIKIFHIL